MAADDLDRESAALNARMHGQGERLSCCGPDGSCPVDMWAKAYLAGIRNPYPAEAVLRQLRETSNAKDR